VYLTVGANHSFTERWQVSGDAGGRYTHSVYSFFAATAGARPDSVDNSAGVVAHLKVTYHDDLNTAALIASHDLEPGTASTAVANTTSFYLTTGHRLTEDLSMSLTAGYTIRTSGQVNSAINGINEDVFSVTAGVSYAITPDLAADASYQYTRTFYEAPRSDLYRNLVYVGLTWKRNLLD
jgi:long-subunit fatty acid transport protein